MKCTANEFMGQCVPKIGKKCWDQGGSCEKIRTCKDKSFCGYKLGRGECGNCSHDKFMKKYEMFCKTDDISHLL